MGDAKGGDRRGE